MVPIQIHSLNKKMQSVSSTLSRIDSKLPAVTIDAAFPKWKTKRLKAHTLNMVKLCNTNF